MNNAMQTIRTNWVNALRSPYFLLALVFAMVGGASFAQSTIDLDTNVFIDAINTWLPMAIGIAAIGVGIAGAFALAQFVGRMIINAFDGKL